MATNSNRDTNKRLKAIGLPIELCVKFERLCGIPAGRKPTYVEKIHVSEAMISAMEAAVRNVQLTSADYELIAAEVKRNESRRAVQEEFPWASDDAQDSKETEQAKENQGE